MIRGTAQRIRVTCSCRDSDAIPKVPDAGRVVTENVPRPFQIMHNGVKVYVDSHYGAFNTEIIRVLRGHHEPQEELVFHHVLRTIPPGGVMIELGCFWAFYSLWFQAAVPGAVNYMVEPVESCLAAGRANFELNGREGHFIQASVGRDSRAETPFVHWDGSILRVRQIAVDDFLEEQRLCRVHVLHADVQGAELEMLEGARRALAAKRIDYVFLSSHTEILHQKCLQVLRRSGYGILAAHTPAESYSVDGLIAAAADRGFRLTVRMSKRRSLAGAYRKIKARLRCLAARSDRIHPAAVPPRDDEKDAT